LDWEAGWTVNGICEAVESEPTTCDRPTSMLTPATTDKKKTQKQKEAKGPPARLFNRLLRSRCKQVGR